MFHVFGSMGETMGKQLRYVEIRVKTRAVKVLEDFEAGCLENDLGKTILGKGSDFFHVF